jgi:hypothetical protein
MIYRKESKNNSIRLNAADIFWPKIIHGITINGIPDKRVMRLVGSMGPVTVTIFDCKNFKHNNLITCENSNW